MQIVTCWHCGEFLAADTTVIAAGSSGGRKFCPECKELFETKREETKRKYIQYKVEVTIERALRLIEKQDSCSFRMDEYYDASAVVTDLFRKDSTKFDSAHEVIACIELIRNLIKTKTQQRIGRKKVDFLLPDLKVVLEIDGNLHDFKIGKDSQRDIFILNELNKDDKGWEIIRIPTSLIEKDITKLVPSIKVLYKKRQELRRKYNGFIPPYYSRHNKIAQVEALKGASDDFELKELEKDVLREEEINSKK